MFCCVTGSTGLLGNNLVRELINQGHQVRVAIRETSDRRPLEGLDVEIMVGSLDSPQFASQLVDGIDAMIHSAGFIWFGYQHLEKSRAVNVECSRILAEQCRQQSVRFLHVSSTDALAAGTINQPANETNLNPAKGKSSYVLSKREAEQVILDLHKNGLDTVIANPSLMLGPYDWKPSTGQMMLAVTDGFIPFTPRGGISVADVRQVAKGIITAVQRGKSGERYILAGQNLTYLKLWRRMAGVVNRKGPWTRMPPRMAFVVGVAGDLYGKVKRRETNVNSAAIKLGAYYNYYDSSKAKTELDYESGDLDQLLKDSWTWLLENGYSSKSKVNDE